MIREMIKKLFNDEAGVSPIVATLVLIVVAIAGAAAVGMIMGTFSSNVADNANTGNTAQSASTEILVAGSTTVQPVSELLAKAYMAKYPGIKITVQGGGSGAGIASAGTGVVDIGAASKYLTNDDKAKYPELDQHTIGGSAVVVIEHGFAAVPAYVTKAELKALYDGNTSTVTIGGINPAAGTLVYQRTEASGTEETFAGFLGLGSNVDSQIADTNTVLANAIGNDGVLKAIMGSTGPAIGFVDYGYAKDAGATMIPVDTDATGTGTYAPVPVNDANVKAGVKARLAGTETTATTSTTYPVELCRPLNYLTNGQPSSTVDNFVQFAMSPGSLDYFHKAGYFGISELS
ncbi:substrate-binding domain-containing protein [uncultured Methanomethylovorans sp.]|uniref:PstS family phosphate ABC transporter substrate-binding protein n=1 Tax=uncultured Methanomethylovorans sp. TaxID=183759 RepID=UPI002AA882A5|nr:substrate-binding domain-containing protein [uncultured Methanomethylovorans sp.]